MSIKEPFTDVDIPTANTGFYEGQSIPLASISKLIMVVLVLWALIWSDSAGAILSSTKWDSLNIFNTFYIISVGAFAVFLFIIAAIPNSGRRRLSINNEGPEFSRFSWFAMMFGAGLGVGLMVFATAEPIWLWGSNPETVAGKVTGNTAEGLTAGYRYTFLHYGFHAWAIYVAAGLSMCYYAYTRGMPLTIRSALTPLFGRHVNGPLGAVIDIVGVIATILGVAVTIGFGVSQFINGLYAISGMEWMMDLTGEAPTPNRVGLIAGLIVIMAMSILSAVSGVGRGIKWLSNGNLVMSLILLMTFVIFGSFAFAMTTYGAALGDYLLHFFQLSFGAHGPQSVAEFSALPAVQQTGLSSEDLQAVYASATNAWGSLDSFRESLPENLASLPETTTAALYEAGTDGRLFGWQAGWTTFYWAWWIAFAPFVGLFLARISKGRTIREFVLGAVIAPSLVCWLWMTILGGTAIDLELTGVAEGAITGAENTAKLFVTLGYMLGDGSIILKSITIMSIVLILTFLVTSADSGILVINTIVSGGEEESDIRHRIIWGIVLTSVIGVLLFAGGGGLSALQDAMIIGALPFTIIMVLMCISLGKALYNDYRRESAE
ncbi:BCCT family transporter [Ostreibacterium oceani]|uniref:BCCT family transporter n=1 Tax=Ostreibacterium oceani TaxID=2654998 RepID=A0A6N7EUP7_9GAMM|nr:BCCT family transporter [Ostreibacterium oceani]MPV86281.1 BCCT family transporter [Ostreibacterium oceani]